MGKKKNAREVIENSLTTKTEPKKSKVASTRLAILIDRARVYIKENYNFRYNIIANEIEFKNKNDKLYKKFSDWDYNTIMIELDLDGINIPDNKFRQLLVSVYISERYDPIKEYIFSLPKWNGKKDFIKEFLGQVYLTREKERKYILNGFKKWFVAFVMSFLNDDPEPYFINQVALILLSKKQGLYKSTWLGSIIPKDMRLKYYYPNSFDAHSKDHLKYLATKMLINLDEMESYNKTDIGIMKSVITASQVALRLPYGRTDIEVKRRASFCGSINNRQFLRDETGSRRWFIVELDGIDYKMNYNVSGMYAQALELYKNGFQYWFNGNDIAEMEAKNAEFTELSMEEELLLQTFYKSDDDDDIDVQTLTTSQIASIIAKDNERMNINNSVIRLLGKALSKHGFERVSFKQSNSKFNIYGWKVKPALIGNVTRKGNEQENIF